MNPKLEEILNSLTPNPEDVLLIKSLFSHPGWKRYEDTVTADIEFLTAKIDSLTDGRTILDQEKIDELKHYTILRYALKSMLVRRDQLLDEIKNPLEDDYKEDDANFTVPENGA